MVCTEYGEIYCLTKDALMEVAELYEGVCVCVCVCVCRGGSPCL